MLDETRRTWGISSSTLGFYDSAIRTGMDDHLEVQFMGGGTFGAGR